MRTAHTKILNAIIVILSLCNAPARGQTTSKGDLDADAPITTTSRINSEGDQVIYYELTNHYSQPLVAGSYYFKCDGYKNRGDRWGRFDAALNNSFTIAPNQPFRLAAETEHCTFSLTSLIFADGREDGDDQAIAIFKKRREWALAKLRPFVELVHSQLATGGKLDLDVLIKAVQNTRDRIDAMTAENSERTGAERNLIASLLDETMLLKSNLTNPRYIEIEHIYVARLDGWLRALSQPNYPDGIANYTLRLLNGEKQK